MIAGYTIIQLPDMVFNIVDVLKKGLNQHSKASSPKNRNDNTVTHTSVSLAPYENMGPDPKVQSAWISRSTTAQLRNTLNQVVKRSNEFKK